MYLQVRDGHITRIADNRAPGWLMGREGLADRLGREVDAHQPDLPMSRCPAHVDRNIADPDVGVCDVIGSSMGGRGGTNLAADHPVRSAWPDWTRDTHPCQDVRH